MPSTSLAPGLWETVKCDFKSLFPEEVFQMWFEPVVCLETTGDSMVLGVSNDFAAIWIQDNYLDLITQRLRLTAGRMVNVTLRKTDAAARHQHGSNGTAARAESPSATTAGRPKATTTRRTARYDGPPVGTLNPRNTFENFVVGSNNQMAHAASLAVAQAPAQAYNPLFLYGGPGLGKTHLLHAVGHALLDQGLHVVYLSAEAFTNQLITAIQQRKMDDFRARYRSADALLMDDIQFIAGKEQTQEEFFYTFNELYEAGKQIVITSDKSPAHIQHLEERLRTRFEWGMIADLQAPDIETRIAILRHKAAEQHLRVGDDVLSVIAARFKNNIRELEGSLTRVVAYSRLTGEALTPELVHSALASLEPTEPRLPPSPELIMDIVCRYFEIDREGLLSKSREKRVAYPRQVAMYLMRELAHRSLVEIGDALGGRDHSTVHHGWRKMERSLAIDPETKRDIGSLREMIESSRRIA